MNKTKVDLINDETNEVFASVYLTDDKVEAIDKFAEDNNISKEDAVRLLLEDYNDQFKLNDLIDKWIDDLRVLNNPQRVQAMQTVLITMKQMFARDGKVIKEEGDE